jgi:hypothetical protein
LKCGFFQDTKLLVQVRTLDNPTLPLLDQKISKPDNSRETDWNFHELKPS